MFWLKTKALGESVWAHQIHVFPHIIPPLPLPHCWEDEGRSRRNGGRRDQLIFTDTVLAAGLLCIGYFLSPLCTGVMWGLRVKGIFDSSMMHLVSGHTQDSQVSVWGRRSGGRERGTQVTPYLLAFLSIPGELSHWGRAGSHLPSNPWRHVPEWEA